MKRNIFLALFIIVCLSLCACSSDVSSVTTSSSTDMSTESMQTDIPVSEQTSDAQQPLTEPPVDPAKTAVSGVMSACFFDVGQADATLLMGPDFTILIDAGDYSNDDIVPYLNSAGVKDIDLIIGTHPHADHIGQFPQVFENFEVQEAWLSGDETTSRTFERALDAILDSDAEYCEPRAGETYEFGSLHIEVINPEHLTGELHEDCVSLRAVYGDVSFMFTGDAEVPTEMEILDRGYNLQAQILQLGHHGSSTSSCQEFLDAVQPEIAIYSAGQDNDYGHPHDETVSRVLQTGITLYGTDIHGTIIVETDGTTYQVIPEKDENISNPLAQVTEASEPAIITCCCDEGQIDINSASLEELQQIIHIGLERAQEIIFSRPFDSLDQLDGISGIGPSRLEDIKEQGLACVGN